MKRIEVCAAILHHEGRILATQRGYGDFKDGWEFPGGKMEPGETPEECIVREIKEELNVDIVPEALLTTVERDYPAFHLTMHCFWSAIAANSWSMKPQSGCCLQNSTPFNGFPPTWRSLIASRSD